MNASGTWDFRPQQETFGREDRMEAGRGWGTLISSDVLFSSAVPLSTTVGDRN